MKLFYVAALLLFPARAFASMDVDCRVDLDMSNRITRIDMDQQVGAERIECASGSVSVVRIVKTAARARAEAAAEAFGRASASYSDYCSCYGTDCSGSCHTSGSDSDTCRQSDYKNVEADQSASTKFVVARVSLAALSDRGFSARQAGDTCQLSDSAGAPVETLKAIAMVIWIYGDESLKQYGMDFAPLVKCGAKPLLQDMKPLDGGTK